MREFGIRVALGAQSGQVVRLAMRHGQVLIAWGIAIGLPVVMVLNWILASVLFRIHHFEPILLLQWTGLLMILGSAACYLPARKAIRVDPVITLKAE